MELRTAEEMILFELRDEIIELYNGDSSSSR